MEEQDKQNNGVNGISFKIILGTIKEYILVILAVIIAFTSVGVIYAYTKKTNYTASENINYYALNKNSPLGVQQNINIMRAYIDTIIDFCDEGIVIDEANFLYNEYEKSNEDIDSFVNRFLDYYRTEEAKQAIEVEGKTMKEVSYKLIQDFSWNNGYMPNQENVPVKILSSSVSSSPATNDFDETTSFVFKLAYTDADPVIAKEKLRILALAVKIEAFDAFGGVSTRLLETVSKTADVGASADFSKANAITLFVVIGVVVAALLVLLLNALNNTVSNRDDLEKITGVNVLSCIEKMED